MLPPQYQFNLGGQDPLLSNVGADNYYRNIDAEIQKLNEYKQYLAQNGQQPIKQNSLWGDVDKEIASLNDDQKSIIAKDENYIAIERELQYIIQEELINSVKGKVASTKRGKELLEAQLKYIRDNKAKIAEESKREIELFKAFQNAVQANPNLTYAEFVKQINNK